MEDESRSSPGPRSKLGETTTTGTFFRVPEGGVERARLEDVADRDLGAARAEVRLRPSREDAHALALGQERFDHVAAEEAGAAGDEDHEGRATSSGAARPPSRLP